MAATHRFGLIGCGSQGRYLSEALRSAGRADLVACADPNQEAARTAVHQCGYRETFDSAEAMLEAIDLDAVIVATIHDQLQPMAMEAVEAGVNVFVEKPMALNVADGQSLVDAADAAG
ncbi:MAG: Gfo/Idh/MocA family protein, partial [Armatimonadota bacterium]